MHNFWNNKKVLITGHTGFKGSWLSIWLNLWGAEVMGYALEPRTEKDNFVTSHLKNEITDLRGDIRDFDRLLSTIKKFRPEIVFHLAAQSLVRLSYHYPKDTYDTNIGGTVNLLECCRTIDSVRVIINVTSDKCYMVGNDLKSYREDDRLGGSDPYSSSKAGSEIVTEAYRQSFFSKGDKDGQINLASVRAGNVIGGGDWCTDRLIPDCIRFLEEGQKIVLRNPKSVRPWQYVLEPLYGYISLASKMYDSQSYNGAWNFGPNSESHITVESVVDLVVDNWGEGSISKMDQKEDMVETNILILDSSKAKEILGWTPLLSIEEAVQNTINWYKSYSSENIRDFCVSQIQDYYYRANLQTK